jgi:twinkle protein
MSDSADDYLAAMPKQDMATAQKALLKGNPHQIKTRGISEKTCRVYDYIVAGYLGKPAQVACYRNDDGLITAQHVRYGDKQFAWIGRRKDEKIQLFGQHLGNGGRLVITEGELDALSIAECLSEASPFGKDTVLAVSIPDGAQSAVRAITNQLLWIGRFDEVIIFLDMDEPGRKAAIDVAALIGAKSRVVTSFAYKDANEALMAGDGKAIREALVGAKKHRPEAVVHAPDLLSKLLTKGDGDRGIQLPWVGWNRMTLGVKPGELWLLAGGTNIGKSAISRSISLDFAKRGIRNAYVALEESCEETLERMMSEELGYNPPFHADTPEERARRDPDKTRSALAGFAPNLFLLDKHIDESFDSFVATVKHYVVAEGCKVVFLDHFSILADGIDLKADQRRAIDKAIKELKSLCVHYRFAMIAVCHLSRDRDHVGAEVGGKPEIHNLRGSQSLGQIPDYVVMLQRNPEAEDPIEANTTTCWLKKNRPIGRRGEMCKLHYLDSCRFHEIIPFFPS